MLKIRSAGLVPSHPPLPCFLQSFNHSFPQFLYCNSAFEPSPDQSLSDLYKVTHLPVPGGGGSLQKVLVWNLFVFLSMLMMLVRLLLQPLPRVGRQWGW